MNFTDPSLYAVTPREMNVPFGGGYTPWQTIPQFLPPYVQQFQAYGMQPFPYPLQVPYTTPFQYGQYAMPPFYGQFKPPYAVNPTQSFVPPFAQGYLPFPPMTQGWQRPFWY